MVLIHDFHNIREGIFVTAKIQKVDFPYKKKLRRGVKRAFGVACWVDRAKADKTYILNSVGVIVSHH